jgi:hypothetical protein
MPMRGRTGPAPPCIHASPAVIVTVFAHAPLFLAATAMLDCMAAIARPMTLSMTSRLGADTMAARTLAC